MTSDFATKSFWLGADAYAPGPALQEDLDVDVAIVGAGFTGLSTAYHLHQTDPGLRIAILESEVVGYGASGRNAGFSMTKIGMMHSFTATRFGKAKAREAHLYADRAVTLLKDLVAELDLDCDYEHTGFLWVATSEKYSQRLLKEIALVHRLGITGVNLIDHDELLDRVNSPLYRGPAWWEPNTGILNPAKLSRAWRGVLDAAGVPIYENTPVTSVTPGNGRTRVATPGGIVTARKVVLATNAWSHLVRAVGLQAGAGMDLHRSDRAPHRRAARFHRVARPRGCGGLPGPGALLPVDRGQPAADGRSRRSAG